MQSLDVIADKLATTSSADIALKALDISTKAMGFGARHTGGNVQNNFVVQIPGKAVSEQDWADSYAPVVIEAKKTPTDQIANPLPMKVADSDD
jgi:hypothetical protein